MNAILEHESTVRLSFFVGAFALFALIEIWKPFRQRRFTRWQRWPQQLLLVFINGLCLQILLPIAAVGTALWAAQSQWGLLNWLPTPGWAHFFITILLLDFAIYWQHVLAHRWHWFWRLHRTHHADTDFDLTTGIRFHPLEIVLSMLIKMALVALLGLDPLAVVVFEVILNASAMFNHSNFSLPSKIEPWVRALLVTPDMHRVHHSVEQHEHDSNYGFFLSVWDRWFKSYTPQTERQAQTMPIGLCRFRTREDVWLYRILMIPFVK